MMRTILLLVLSTLSSFSYAQVGAVHISCNAPTQTEDGMAFLKEQVNFYIIYLTLPDTSIKEFRVKECEADFILPYGKYSHQILVCDTNLLCSSKSSIRYFTVKTPPKKPTYPGVRVI